MGQDIFVVIEHLQGQVSDISYIMLAGARVLAQESQGSVVAVLLGWEVQNLASDLAADRILYADHLLLSGFNPEIYISLVSGLIEEYAPRAVLFGDTSMGAELAGGLSARLGLPVVSFCRDFRLQEGVVKYVSQICGGKMMVEGDLPAAPVLVTMIPGALKPEDGRSAHASEVTLIFPAIVESQHIRLLQYIQPEVGDVDISKESILVSVGRGIQNKDNLEIVQELANILGGTLSASRPVVDQGWLPTSRLVGKSGNRVKPRLYLALGISGAPEHVEAITDSEVIIAVNTDESAPIFNLAKYGTTLDLFDLVPVLTEKIARAKAALDLVR